jgi:hypothetical protein
MEDAFQLIGYNVKSKGQMSFDLAFAVIIVLAILGMVVNVIDETRGQTVKDKTLIALNSLADYTFGEINSFYNSLRATDGNATLKLPLPNKWLFDNSNAYSTKYNVTYVDASKILKFSSGLEYLNRTLAFQIECASGSLPTVTPASAGQTLWLRNCKITSTRLSCVRCSVWL